MSRTENQTPYRGDPRRQLTDAYVFIMLLFFPVFTGLRGYASITLSKYLFFTIATAAWLSALALLTFRLRRRPERPGPAQQCALIFMAVCCLSTALSPYRTDCLLGAGRYDGLVTLTLCALIFLGISAFGTLRPCHTRAFALSCTLCCLVAAAQLLGYDPLGLYPGQLTYYDAHTLYSGEFLGTVGNVNMLSALLTLAIPLFFSLIVLRRDKYAPAYSVPLFLCVLTLVLSGVSGGSLAVLVCSLCAPALLVRNLDRARSALSGAAVCLFACALALSLTDLPDPRTHPVPASVLCLALGAACLLAAASTRLVRRAPDPRRLRRAFICAALCLLLAALAVIWFWPGTDGTVYELSQAMRGRLEDGFGSSRVLIWRSVLELVPERPFFGGGPGSLALRLELSFSRYVPETGRTLSSFVDNAHNEYLQILADTGALGLLSYLALLLCALLRCLRRADARDECACVLLSLVCYCVQDFFGLGLSLVSPLFWILLGLSQPAPDGGSDARAVFTGGPHE